GSRSINNVVDATNHVLHELGQPTHAFDLARLRGAQVIVRRARAGERLVTLDGTERTLGGTMPVIADAEGAQALAGIMGGRHSEVGEGTTDLFIEVAVFDPAGTRAARRALGMSTDASYRFERGVDEELPPIALERVTQLIVSLAGGTVDGAPIDVHPAPTEETALSLRAARVATLLGEAVPVPEIAALLASVGFDASPVDDEVLTVIAPSWRRDVIHEVDLIEEVARLRGYDSFPDELRPQRPGAVPDSIDYVVSRRVREALVAVGLLEARPMPFVAAREGAEYVRVANPLAENEAYLRREVLETLARRAEHNLAHQQGNVRLFEIGAAFLPASPYPTEEVRVAALVMGDRRPRHFTQPNPPAFDEWDAAWLAEIAARAAWPTSAVELRPAEDPAALWDVIADGTARGSVRRLALDAPVWASPAFGFELSLFATSAAETAGRGEHAWEAGASAPASKGGAARKRFRSLPTTPPAPFDLALLVPDAVAAAEVERAIRRAAGDVLESLELFDLFEGQGVEPGFRSLAWTLILRHPDRTLTTKEIEARRERILSTLHKELHVRARTA
ncbi:MAG TPA: phenylalanine--tRNA ligase subunit beta, partial [Gemmatimonadaceae bacterium]|nr:phenylalanine--tRNA ligase subunit beta [Gemmatimonadaceae bacterium]